ncbi:MAG: WYL domain-containing protein, partial [Actinomycetota bacterium]|nr:WYL domain-containing protein [Actinomycetota bacterium]
PAAGDEEDAAPENGRRSRAVADAAIRPERFARLVTLASVLIQAGRAGERLQVADVCEQLQMSEQELREDVSVLNVVNFGGGAYVLYAEVHPNGEIEVDPEPYSDTFDRPARLLPIEAKALVAAIDLLGDHLPAGALNSAREKIVAALGEDPVREGLQITSAGADDPELARVIAGAIAERRLLELEYYAANEDQFSTRVIEPYGLINSVHGWYVASWDPSREDSRHFRLDRIKHARVLEQTYEPRPDLDPVADIEGWPKTGEVPASRIAHVWISPEQARWAREERTVLAELGDGALVVEWAFKGEDYLVKEVLKEAGDAAVLEPADAREAVLIAAERLLAPATRTA